MTLHHRLHQIFPPHIHLFFTTAFYLHPILFFVTNPGTSLNPLTHTMKQPPNQTMLFGWLPCNVKSTAWKRGVLLNERPSHLDTKRLASDGHMTTSITQMAPSFEARKRLVLLCRGSVNVWRILARHMLLLSNSVVFVFSLPMPTTLTLRS